jgi:hypothetical protein
MHQTASISPPKPKGSEIAMRDMLYTCVVSLVLALAGGSAFAQQYNSDEPLPNDLRNIRAAWFHVGKTTKKAPTNLDDIIKVLSDLKEHRAIERLRSGSVLIYGGFLDYECTYGTSHTALAYDIGTPIRGGWMVLADGTAWRVNKDEFESAVEHLPKKAYILKVAKPVDAVGKITLDDGNRLSGNYCL